MPPLRSEHSFVGVVVRTSANGRVAEVRQDDGRTVTVRGGETRDNAASSVDRYYDVGARYEFHPVNAEDPYEDNECTATRRLGGGVATLAAGGSPPASPAVVPAAGSSPASPAVVSQSGSSGWLLPGVAGLVLVAAGAAAVRRTSRRRAPLR